MDAHIIGFLGSPKVDEKRCTEMKKIVFYLPQQGILEFLFFIQSKTQEEIWKDERHSFNADGLKCAHPHPHCMIGHSTPPIKVRMLNTFLNTKVNNIHECAKIRFCNNSGGVLFKEF